MSINGNGVTTAIEEVEVAADGGDDAEYFDLQGRRVANPAAGIFLRRQGGTVSKVAIR